MVKSFPPFVPKVHLIIHFFKKHNRDLAVFRRHMEIHMISIFKVHLSQRDSLYPFGKVIIQTKIQDELIQVFVIYTLYKTCQRLLRNLDVSKIYSTIGRLGGRCFLKQLSFSPSLRDLTYLTPFQMAGTTDQLLLLMMMMMRRMNDP